MGVEETALGVGLIGCGSIGTVLAQAIDKGKAGKTRLIMVYDLNFKKAEALAGKLVNKPRVATTFKELLECGEIELIIEAASQEAVRQYSTKILEANRDLMIMSVGALVDGNLLKEIQHKAQEKDRKVYIPSGAIAGLDGVKASSLTKIKKVILLTKKPPEGLKGAPYIKQRGIKLSELSKPTLIYRGPASEACKLFPANVNVAAALSLVGVGPEKTEVRIMVDPRIRRNIHEVRVLGSFGELITRTRNVPSPDNPKTSYLAALSAVATLKKVTENILIGT